MNLNPINMEVPQHVPFILEAMVAVISVVTIALMIYLTIKIYKDDARNEDAGPKNKGW